MTTSRFDTPVLPPENPRVIDLTAPAPPSAQWPAAPATVPYPQGPTGPPPAGEVPGGRRPAVVVAWVAGGLAIALVLALVAVLVTRSGDSAEEAAEEVTEQEVPVPPAVPEAPPVAETPPVVETLPEAAAPEGGDRKPDAGDGIAPVAPGTMQVDVVAAGVELSWLRLPYAASYVSFTWLTDDSGAVAVEVPVAWADVNGAADSLDGVSIPSLWAAPVIPEMTEQWTGPGLILELRQGAAATIPEQALEAMADAVGADDACTERRDHDYDDGLYAGVAAVHGGCGSADVALLQIAAADGAGGVLAVQVQMATTADVEAAAQVIWTFQAVAPQPAPPAPVPAPAAPAPVAPAPAPAPAPVGPVSVYDLPAGYFCRDLDAMGYNYVEAMEYWYTWGQPDRMDADRDGIPCETVYPAWEIDDYWGVTPTDPIPADPWADEAAQAMAVAEGAMRACGYTPTYETWVDGPAPDGGWAVGMTVDVGWDLVYAEFEVLPWSGEIFAFDSVGDDLLWCAY